MGQGVVVKNGLHVPGTQFLYLHVVRGRTFIKSTIRTGNRAFGVCLCRICVFPLKPHLIDFTKCNITLIYIEGAAVIVCKSNVCVYPAFKASKYVIGRGNPIR